MNNDRHIYFPDTPRRAPAVAAMFLSAFLFSVMTFCAKLLNQPAVAGRTLPAWEVSFFRFFFGLIAVLPLFGYPPARLIGNNRRGLFLRGIYGGGAVYFLYLSLHHTTLMHAVLLNYTSILFAPLFTFLFLHERMTGRAGLAMGVAVLGILLVTRPEAGAFRMGDLYGLLSGLIAGAAITEIRLLRRTETAASVFFYFSLLGTPISLIGWIGQPFVWPTATGWGLLLCMAATSGIAQVLMTYGYRYMRTSEGTLITVSQLAYTVMISGLLLHEPFTTTTLLGGALILGAAIWMGKAGQG